MTIAQARCLLSIAKSDFMAGRIQAHEYLTRRTELQEAIVALCAELEIPLCRHGRLVSCMQCALRGEKCRGHRGNIGFTS
jgi:hypothetical protein